MKGKVEAIIGTQWGDEGKGRVVDAVASRVDVVVRYQGGANAGHTVMAEGETYIFHLLPSGMLYPGKTCVIGNGVVVDPQQLIEELEGLQKKGKDRARLVVSRNAHVVMPYHKVLDGMEERFRGTGKRIGTTRRGIGPCYMDKVSRRGIRVEDLLEPDILREKLTFNLEYNNMLLTRIYEEPPLSFGEIYDEAIAWGERLAPYTGDGSLVIHRALDAGETVLLEGAQGTLLDIDHGTYPFVTSSNAIGGGGCAGAGIGPVRISRMTGVTKAYCTRVGAGPFPTEAKEEASDRLRDRGGEYGATTGRPRRCGWLDLVALKHAVRVNGLTGIALTKLDVLSGEKTLPVCVAYSHEGHREENFRGGYSYLEKVKPIYREFPGWDKDISACDTWDSLPEAARNYVSFIEGETGVPVVFIGVGAKREQMVRRGL